MSYPKQHIIPLPDIYSTTPLIIADGKCDVCLHLKLCLIADSKDCIDKHFAFAKA